MANVASYVCDGCDKEFGTLLSFCTHYENCTGYRFSCIVCDKPVKKSNLWKHLRIHTVCEKQHACMLCGKTFLRKRSLNTHLVIHSENRERFPCMQCGKTYSREHNLLDHQKVHRGENPQYFPCSFCDKKFARNFDLTQHERSHRGDSRNKCDICSRIFARKSTMLNHRKLHGDERPFSCDKCEKSFKQRTALWLHLRYHKGAVKKQYFPCSVCEKRYSRKSDLSVHERTHREDCQYKCDICFRNFSTKKGMMLHQKLHSGERPFACDQCDKTFLQKGTLTIHQNTHKGEDRPYFTCFRCEKKFTLKSSLTQHLASHMDDFAGQSAGLLLDMSLDDGTNERQGTRNKHPCSVCEKRYSRKHDLARHESTHREDGLNKCDVCFRNFFTHKDMLRHRKHHSSERSFACDQCDRTFAQKGHLTVHLKIHKGEDRQYFKCSVCDKRYSDKRTLAEHELTHEDDCPNKCDVCLRKFSSKHSLMAHIRVHSDHPIHNHLKILASSNQEPDQTINFKEESDLQSSMASSSNSCPDCNVKFEDMESLTAHQLSCSVHCSIDAGDVYVHSLAADTKLHSDIRDTLLQKTATAVNRYACEKCEKTFKYRNGLAYHMRSHTGFRHRPFRCNSCEKGFPSRRELRRHEYVHSSEHLFACSICDKTFKHKDSLRKHAYTHNVASLSPNELLPFAGDPPILWPSLLNVQPSEDEHANDFLHEQISTEGGCIRSNDSTSTRLNNFDMKSASRRWHTRRHERPFSCSKCTKTFRYAYELRSHMRSHQESHEYLCCSCDKRFSTRLSLQRHELCHNGERQFVCSVCEKSFKRRSELRVHLFAHYVRSLSRQRIVTQACTHESDPSDSLTPIVITTNHDELLQNGDLELSTIMADSHSPGVDFELGRHTACDTGQLNNRTEQHRRPSEECIQSQINKHRGLSSPFQTTQPHIHDHPYIVASSNMEQDRMLPVKEESGLQSSTASSSSRCPDCNVKFEDAEILMAHQRSCTVDYNIKANDVGDNTLPLFACDNEDCGKTFRHQDSLTLHQNAHEGLIYYPCSLCDKRFQAESSLVYHELMHRYDFLNKCKVCFQTFSSNFALLAHMKEHNKSQVQILSASNPNVCPICRLAVFQNGEALRVHQLSCTRRLYAPTPLACNKCDKIFARKKDFILHKNVHEGEVHLSYLCLACDERFTSKYHLSNHELIHRGDIPNKCNICSRLLSSTSALLCHMRLHCNERLFSCNKCSKAFKNERSLQMHKHSDHKCRFRCNNRRDLKNHESVHCGVPLLVCSVCEKRFYSGKDLYRHTLRCHRPVRSSSMTSQCEINNNPARGSSSKSIATISEHSSRSSFSSIVVRERRKTAGSLTDCVVHRSFYSKTSVSIRTHVSAYTCSDCHLTFDDGEGLRLHRIPGKNVRFRCGVCVESFGTSDEVKMCFKQHFRCS